MIQSLELVNFRNIKAQRVDFTASFNALVGHNGQGKTNVLEAVYYLSLLRSFRTAQVNDLKQWKTEGFRLKGLCQQGNLPQTTLEVAYGDERKLAINGNHVYRTSEFINQFICVTFIPQDMELIRGSEALRRRFLDIAISQVSPVYLKHLQAYHEALKTRNALLREPARYGRDVMAAYDEILVQNGIHVELERRTFTRKLNERLQESSESLLDSSRNLSLKYLSGMGTAGADENDDPQEIARTFHETLNRNLERDTRDGFTHAGPHRAEFACLLNQASLRHFGSEGECRMASLAVKFACLDIIRGQLDASRITLLVDDVIGELDADRQRKFFSRLRGTGQIIMAGTCIPEALEQEPNIMRVHEGIITPDGTSGPQDDPDGRL